MTEGKNEKEETKKKCIYDRWQEFMSTWGWTKFVISAALFTSTIYITVRK
jgi:hypothetical protein